MSQEGIPEFAPPPPPPPAPATKHSIAGIISLAIALLGILSLCASFGVNALIGNGLPDSLAVNRSVDALIYCSGGLALIGLILGVVGVVQRNVRKVFGIIGLILNLVGLCVIAVMLGIYFFV